MTSFVDKQKFPMYVANATAVAKAVFALPNDGFHRYKTFPIADTTWKQSMNDFVVPDLLPARQEGWFLDDQMDF
jgi:hypothetical protein